MLRIGKHIFNLMVKCRYIKICRYKYIFRNVKRFVRYTLDRNVRRIIEYRIQDFFSHVLLPIFSSRYIKIYAKYMSISFFFLNVISDSDIRFYDTPMNGDRIKYYISQRTVKIISRTIVRTLYNNFINSSRLLVDMHS